MYKQILCFICWTDKFVMFNRERKPTPGIWNGVGGKMGEIVGKGQVKEFVKAEHLQLNPRKSQNVQTVLTAFDIKKSELLV